MTRPLSAAAVALCGCSQLAVPLTPHGPRHYETVRADPYRDSEAAAALTRKAHAAVLCEDWEGAEALLREALLADPACGPAHNSLGFLYHRQGRAYLAAWEFDAAAALMPGLPEPAANAALVLEEAGRLNEAAARYEEALAADPGFPPVLANTARCLAKLDGRAGRPSLRTAELLREVVG